MNIWEVMEARHSVRAYRAQKIETEKVEALHSYLQKLNAESGLNLQLITDEPKGFSGMMAHYGKFSGVENYLVLAGPKGRDYDIGYYGELAVLEAQRLGLNTCWVAMTYNKRKAVYTLRPHDVLYVVISLGYGVTQGVAHKSKSLGDVSDVTESSPLWYRKGVEAALLAPTAMNQQKFHFTLDGEQVIATTAKGPYTKMDLGIARCHFDLAVKEEKGE